VPYVEANMDIWIYLGEESWQADGTLLETMQQLHTRMMKLRIDNELMSQEKEKILKSLSNQQNQ